MKIMAIDYGDAHTGIAISDYTETLAGYSDTLHSRRQEEVLSGIQRLIAEHGVQLLVLGYPRNMDGTEGPGPRNAPPSARCCGRRPGWRSSSGMSAAPPSTPTTSCFRTGRTPRSERRPWTRWPPR